MYDIKIQLNSYSYKSHITNIFLTFYFILMFLISDILPEIEFKIDMSYYLVHKRK